MTTNKYESSTKYLFVNTEAYDNHGDQINNIKVNLGGNSFESDDDSLIKLSLTQFNMPKNFYNINDTNNAFRVILTGFTHSGTSIQINQIDSILELDAGDYLTFLQVQQNFAEKLKIILDASVEGAGTTFAVIPIASKTDDFAIHVSSTGEVFPQTTATINRRLFGVTVTHSNASFRFDRKIHIHSLHITPTDGLKTLLGGSVLTADQQFNDSAVLFGGNRTLTFSDLDNDSESEVAIHNCFSISDDENVTSILGYYPMNIALHTLPYVYLRVNTVVNNTTSNFENVSHNHKTDIVPSHILAKIERKLMQDGSVYYRTNDEVVYMNYITNNRLSDLQFSVTDDKGRVIPQNNLGINMGNFSQTYTSSNNKINKAGNLYCDFTLKLERIMIPFAPNVLQGFPDPVRKGINSIATNIPPSCKY